MPSALEVFRDYVINGVPSSGPHNPDKREFREWAVSVEGGGGGGGDFSDEIAALDQQISNLRDTTAINLVPWHRPGDSPILFTGTVSGEGTDLEPIDVGSVVTTARGKVLRVPSASEPVIVATRRDMAIEPGRTYAARYAFSRFQNTSDPLGDAVECKIAWLDNTKTYISAVTVDARSLVVADGRRYVAATFSLDQEADFTAPSTAIYVRVYLRLLGGNGITDIETTAVEGEGSGIPGPKGDTGQAPSYEIDGVRIRWALPNGTPGDWLDLNDVLGIDFRGDWLVGDTYDAPDLVAYGDSTYIARRESTGVEPGTSPDDWRLFIPGGTVGDGAVTRAKIAASAFATEEEAIEQDEAEASPLAPMNVLRTLQAARASLKEHGHMSAKIFGASGSYDLSTFSGPDDGQALQDAFDAGLEETQGKGAEIVLPGGNYYTAQTLDFGQGVVPGTVSDFGRVSLRGAGAGATQIVVNTPVGLRSNGGADAGVHSYQTIEKLRLRAVGGVMQHTALGGNKNAYLRMCGVVVENFEYGANLTDMLSSEFDHCVLRGNRYGLVAARGDFSHPNAVSLRGTKIQGSGQWAIIFAGPAALTLYAGSIEGNGTDTTAGTNCGGIQMTNPGTEGATGIACHGTYFEYNAGLADFYCTSGGVRGDVANSFHGATFAQIDATRFVDHHIRVEAEVANSLSLFGCGFKVANDYVPSAARKVIYWNPAVTDFFEAGTKWGAAIEIPDAVLDGWTNGQTNGQTALAIVNDDGAIVAGHRGVYQVSKLGTGAYRVTFKGPDLSARFTQVQVRGTAGYAIISNEGVDGNGRFFVDVLTYGTGATAADRQFAISSSGGR